MTSTARPFANGADPVRPGRNPAVRLTLLCMLSVVPVLLTAWFGPQEGLETLVIIIPGMLMLGVHILLGPLALLHAWQIRRHAMTLWISLYFATFTVLTVGYWAWLNEVPQQARSEWRQLTRPEDAALSAALQSRDDDTAAVERALDQGADVNALTPDYRTPLMEAVIYSRENAIERLLEAGADPNRIADGYTALYYACANLQPAIVEQLLEGGADPNQRSDSGLPACRVLRTTGGGAELPERQHAIINALLAAGADFTLPCEKSSVHTPLHIAVSHGQRDLVAQVVAKRQKLKVGQQDSLFGGVLQTAVKAGDITWLESLLAAGISPDAGYRGQSRALTAAIKSGDAAAVSLLLAAGADANYQDYLYQVSRLYEDREDLLQLLLEHGAKVQVAEDRPGPLYEVARRGWQGQVELLLSAGADPNGPDFEGKSLLFSLQRRPAKAERLAVMPLLIKAGAMVDARDKKQRTPFMIAIFREDPETATLLTNAGADINATDTTGRSAAHHAATLYNALPMIEWLIANDADFSRRDNEGKTPACIAVAKRKEEVVAALTRANHSHLDCEPR